MRTDTELRAGRVTEEKKKGNKKKKGPLILASYVSGGQPTDVAGAQFSGHVKFGVNKKNKK